ncbi:SDR family oxidoreductase [Paenibacillus sp. IB182496]|uniref:SDR family oxidoreductase n=1 Tax=Paenibacillus sabuli TaxID=2772509 RepID=A0A927BWZ8_9BACL|nr:SDR family oxidoreductase [Paenibacillus sabuli]MBD2848426.1 SDR family oxidoreductase [Paenibacillus sabuli]
MATGKKVLITGATSGIGLRTAVMLAQRGALPILTGRSADKLRAATEAVAGAHAAYVLDVTDSEQVAETMERVRAEHGVPDVLVNNAGFGWFEAAVDAPLAHYEAMMDTNYMGMVRCTKALLPHMLARGGGQILTVASIAGKLGTPKSTGYSATKHAVLGFANALRLELAGTGVAVSVVNPGPIDTPFFEQADPDGSYVANVRWFMMSPERVAGTIVRVIERPRAEVNLPRMAAAGAKLYQLFPRLADRVAGRWLNQK